MTDYIKVSSLWRLLACDYETQFPPGGAIGDWEYKARWEERWRLRPVTRWPSSGWEQTITFRPHKSYPRCGPGLGLNYIICCRKCQTQSPQKSNKNTYFFSCEDAAQPVLMSVKSYVFVVFWSQYQYSLLWDLVALSWGIMGGMGMKFSKRHVTDSFHSVDTRNEIQVPSFSIMNLNCLNPGVFSYSFYF